jgi:aspartate kinase
LIAIPQAWPCSTSEIKFSLLIAAEYTELAVRTLHSLYELDKA